MPEAHKSRPSLIALRQWFSVGLQFVPVPTSLCFAAAVLCGVRIADAIVLPVPLWIILCGAGCLTAWITELRVNNSGCDSGNTRRSFSLLFSALCLGGLICTVRFHTTHPDRLAQLIPMNAEQQPVNPIRIEGTVASIPSLRTRRELAYRTPDGRPAVQTTLLLRVTSLLIDDRTVAADDRIRVLVDGNLTDRIRWRDSIRVTGRLETSFPLANPAEFNYQRFLEKQSIGGVLYVKHRDAVDVERAIPSWHPAALLSGLRQQAAQRINQHLSEDIRPLAAALLLGNRGHLDAAVERDFIASGTMHLLSISGLHVGIMYLFIVRLLNWLLVSHRRSMMIGLCFCIGYALLTDMRPSVIRATAFIAMTNVGQLLNRNSGMASLIGNTATLFLLFDPGTAFDLGAWLSFLAVTALAWTAERTDDIAARQAPPDALTWRERFSAVISAVTGRLSLRYRQMIGVAVFSMPLVASQFHVVSMSGLIVNILMIPLTAAAMISGFTFIGIGLLVPPLADPSAFIFEALLSILNGIVARAGNFLPGSLTIADTPDWFLGCYYGLLTIAIAHGLPVLRRTAWCSLALLLLIGFPVLNRSVSCEGLRCTVLSVGHGNATVVETPDGRVILFDAGGLNRAERTADAISRFLWYRGHRMIDCVVLSHADIDHYNAMQSLVDRIPIGEVLTSRQFIRSTASPVVELLSSLRRRAIDIRQVFDGDEMLTQSASIQFLQAVPVDSGRPGDGRPDSTPLDDNETSLVATIRFAGRTLAITGDIEKRGLQLLASALHPADVLISPHHGSRSSNTELTARLFKPPFVIVSSRSEDNNLYLKTVYGPDTELLNTSGDGAISILIGSDSSLTISAFRDRQDTQTSL